MSYKSVISDVEISFDLTKEIITEIFENESKNDNIPAACYKYYYKNDYSKFLKTFFADYGWKTDLVENEIPQATIKVSLSDQELEYYEQLDDILKSDSIQILYKLEKYAIPGSSFFLYGEDNVDMIKFVFEKIDEQVKLNVYEIDEILWTLRK